jgi:HK97 family phage portal protein
MAILDRFRTINTAAPAATPDIAATDLAPLNNLNSLYSFINTPISATYSEFISIPSASRAKGIIASSIASIPLVLRDRSTGMRLDAPRVIDTPDPRLPGQATYGWTASDILLYGFAYWQVTELYADTNRVRSVERIAPDRVGIETNANATQITGYTIDGGYKLPDSGVGSLVVFYNPGDVGVLNRAGRTIRTGAELERAAMNYAREPIPSMVLKSNGSALPADRIAKLLEQWGVARRNRTTAYLNADINLEKVGFSPDELGLNTAREHIATEISRACGIPAYFTDAPSGSSMTYSNAVTARQTLLDFSLIPICDAISQRLSMPDFTPSSQVVKHDFDVYLRGSAFERAQIYEIYNRIGVMTADEIMRKEDMAL